MMTAFLQIRLFGGLNISQGNTPLTGFVSNKVPALLAYLAVTHRPHQRDVLAALLWGEMSDADAKNNLRQALSNLRKQLDSYLLITRETVQFNTAVPHTLDTTQFETDLQNGRIQTNHRFHHLAQAAILYQGDFLAGFFVRDVPEFEEWLLELDGLDVPSGKRDERITDYSAAQLFLNRSREAMPDFALNVKNETAVIHICQLVNGLPLAIELAAAWVRHLTCQEIAHEIEQNLSFLATTQKNVPTRHRSLQAAFEHSWALLTNDERTTFARLSVFRGGCTREAATVVAQTHLPILAALCDKSLLRRDVDGRYTSHELLRQYAANKFQADPQHLAETQARHCHYYLSFLADREEALDDTRQNEAQREITTEIDNIRTAWAWAVSQQQPNLLKPALESLRVFLEYVGWYTEAINLFRAAADVAQTYSGDKSLLFGKLLARQAWFNHRLDRFEVAQPLIEESQAIFRNTRPALPAEEALCLQCLGNMARAMGDFTQAITCYRQSLLQHRVVGNLHHIASSLNGLATAYSERGEFEDASQLHQESLALRREIGDSKGVATTLVNLGFIAFGQARYAEVKPLEQEALDIFREIGYPMGEAVALNNLGVACYTLAEAVKRGSYLRNV